MTNKYDLHLVYVLHSRAFRETSLLVDVLSKEYGKVTVVARGAKRGKTKTSSILQPFVPLNCSWTGAGELVTLTQVEVAGAALSLHGKRGICGLYINELMYKLLHKWDPCVNLFSCYEQALKDLANIEIPEQISLRKFEKALLIALGYGLQLTTEVENDDPILADEYYAIDPALGPRLVTSSFLNAIKGSSLLALAADDYSSAAVLLDIKRLLRSVLAYYLGTKTIVTRQLL